MVAAAVMVAARAAAAEAVTSEAMVAAEAAVAEATTTACSLARDEASPTLASADEAMVI